MTDYSSVPILHTPYHILDNIIRVVTDFNLKDYIDDTKNLLFYSVKLKRKKKEDQATQATVEGPVT